MEAGVVEEHEGDADDEGDDAGDDERREVPRGLETGVRRHRPQRHAAEVLDEAQRVVHQVPGNRGPKSTMS